MSISAIVSQRSSFFEILIANFDLVESPFLRLRKSYA
jgi:hypothetical protein